MMMHNVTVLRAATAALNCKYGIKNIIIKNKCINARITPFPLNPLGPWVYTPPPLKLGMLVT